MPDTMTVTKFPRWQSVPIEKQTLSDLADCLEGADRQGGAKDEPEGSVYVTFSDTIMRHIAARLREIDRNLIAAIYSEREATKNARHDRYQYRRDPLWHPSV